MPKFFINHPVFAWVVAILISLSGVIAILGLGVESYPNIAPPQVTVSASYPGASASTVERAVTQVIEQQLTGIDHLLYFSSSSSATGRASITLTFETGTDPDIAPGAGAEQGVAGHAAPAHRGHPAGRGRGQGQRRLPDGGRPDLRQPGRRPQPAQRHQRLARDRPDLAHRRGQHPAVRRRVRDEHLAGPGEAAGLRPVLQPGAGGDPGAERAVRRRRGRLGPGTGR